MKTGITTVILLLTAITAFAHRLDEYLQATMFSIDKYQLHAEMTLTPGVAVFPKLGPEIADHHAYAERVLRDLTLTIDGQPLTLQLVSTNFPSTDEMKQGMAGIRIAFKADLPPGGSNRRLIFENHHESTIGAYLVNCLVPSDREIHITRQTRDYSQSRYELDYTETGAPSVLLWLGAAALILGMRFAVRRRSAEPTGAAARN